MNCATHNRVIVGGCFWCGRLVCNHCITLANGRKNYCGKCTTDLGSFLRRKLPPMEVYTGR